MGIWKRTHTSIVSFKKVCTLSANSTFVTRTLEFRPDYLLNQNIVTYVVIKLASFIPRKMDCILFWKLVLFQVRALSIEILFCSGPRCYWSLNYFAFGLFFTFTCNVPSFVSLSGLVILSNSPEFRLIFIPFNFFSHSSFFFKKVLT